MQAHLLPLPADLVLVALELDIGVHTSAADELEVRAPPIRLRGFQAVIDRKIMPRAPAGMKIA